MRLRLVFAAVSALFIISLSPTAAGAQTASYGAEPVGVEPQETAQGWFTLSASPGAVLERSIRLRNTSPKRIEFAIAAVGASTMDTGGVSYDPNDSHGDGVSTWVSLAQPVVAVDPGVTATVPFTVRVPTDVGPGDHLAALSIWDVNETPREERPEEGFGATVTVRSRTVIALQLTVDGVATTALAVDGVNPGARPDGPYLLLKLSNPGQRLTKATGTVRVPSADFERSFDVDTFVPGTSIAYPIKWPNEELPPSADVEVDLHVIGGEAVRFASTVSFGDDVRSELADRMVTDPPSLDGRQGSRTSVASIGSGPQRAGAAAAVLVAFLIVTVMLRRRSARSSRSTTGAPPAATPASGLFLSALDHPAPHAPPPNLRHHGSRPTERRGPRRWRRYTPRHSAPVRRYSLRR